jgi:hypothetical protein
MIITRIRQWRDRANRERLRAKDEATKRRLAGQVMAYNRVLDLLKLLYNYVNNWGDFYLHRRRPRIYYYLDDGRITEFGRGYKEAFKDIFDLLGE